MPRDKFKMILRCLRFDDINERRIRVENGDKFAAMTEVWNDVTKIFQMYFRPGQDITIDEQLFGSKARCPITQYMRSKPEKFGQKNWIVVCNESKYILDFIPYLGKDESRSDGIPFAEHIVRKLIDPNEGLGYNVTTDNYFKSKSLGDYLALVERTNYLLFIL